MADTFARLSYYYLASGIIASIIFDNYWPLAIAGTALAILWVFFRSYGGSETPVRAVDTPLRLGSAGLRY